jgi:hypothetical protein
LTVSDLKVVEGGAAPDAATPKRYRASINSHAKDAAVETDFARLIFQLENELECKIWCVIQRGGDDIDEIGARLYTGFMDRLTLGNMRELDLHSIDTGPDYAKYSRTFASNARGL